MRFISEVVVYPRHGSAPTIQGGKVGQWSASTSFTSLDKA